MSTKTDIRRYIKAQRLNLSEDDVRSRSAAITERLKGLCDWTKLKYVHCFVPYVSAGEVDTREFISWLQQLGVKVYNPPGRVPTVEELETEFDAVIVPLVAFDAKHARVGYGGGFYDRLLERQTKVKKIGVAFDFQEVPIVPSEPHDQKLDMVITETRQV